MIPTNRKQRALQERHIKRDRQFTELDRKEKSFKRLPTPEERISRAIHNYLEMRKAALKGCWIHIRDQDLLEEAHELFNALPDTTEDRDTLQSGMLKEWKRRQTKLYKALK